MASSVMKILLPLWLLVVLSGCSPEMNGEIDDEKLFVPVLGFCPAYLQMDLSTQAKQGKMVVHFVDFAGKRITSRVILLTTPRDQWGWDVGRGAEVDGQSFYALSVDRYGGTGPPPKFTFHPFGGLRHGPRGLFAASGRD